MSSTSWTSFVGGGWVESGKVEVLLDPSTEEVIGQVDQADLSITQRAITAARRAFDDGDWRSFSGSKRRGLLEDLADAVDDRMSDFSAWERRNIGYTMRTSDIVHAGGAGAAFREFARAAEENFGRPLNWVGPPSPAMRQVFKEPIGVCAAIIPWNSPLVMSVWKLGPALAMGNTVVLKPAPTAPVTPIELARLAQEVGFPSGVINVVTGGSEIGQELVSNPAVDRVSFTGSTTVGRAIMTSAASTIKRVTLELGGKSASIVLDDADLDLCVDGSIWGFLVNQGQACTSGTRIIVDASVYDEFVARLVDRIGLLRIGYTDDPSSDIGPLHSREHLERVEQMVDRGVDEGAKVLCGGQRPPQMAKGNYYEPTVLAAADNSLSVCQEEIFGPVVSVMKASDPTEAVAIANDSTYGLAGGVWTRDIGRGIEVASQIRAGTVWVNEWNILSLDAPFGGFRQSGTGRELGLEGYESFLETKHVHVGLGSLAQRPYSVLLSGGSTEGV